MEVRDPPLTSKSAEVANDAQVAALSVSIYDYILTLPAEYRFYRAFYRNRFRLTTNLVLFVLIRYVSITLLVLNAVGYWSTFSLEACRNFYLIRISARVLQSMVSQAILGLRAYCISRKNQTVGIVLLLGYIFVSVVQWLAEVYHRTPVVVNGFCSVTTTDPTLFLSPWLFYLTALLYDLLTLTISMGYLFQYHPSSPSTSRLVRMMIYDGLVYFVALTLINTVNAILFRSADFRVEMAATPFSFAFTWILSQRILIHLKDAAAKQPYHAPPPIIRHPNPNVNARDSDAVTPWPQDAEGHGPDKDTDSSSTRSSGTGGEPVQVRVERSVVVGVKPLASASCDESSRTPTVKWNEGLVLHSR